MQAGTTAPDGSRLHVEAYHRLRAAVIRHFEAGNTNPRLHECPLVHTGIEEMQTNGSRLGQVVTENYDFIQLMREREQAAGVEGGVGQAENGNGLEESEDEEGWDNMSDEENILE